MKISFFIVSVLLQVCLLSQEPDKVYMPSIHSVKLYKTGDILSYPVITLNRHEELDLYFDDLDADIKNYYYTYLLCNADWTPSDLHPFDYIDGFMNNRITTYRSSSIAFTRYTHYQLRFPERNSGLKRSGNYLLKVYLDGDTSRLAFTKRFHVVELKSSVGGQVRQPFSGSLFRTHQRLQVAVTVKPELNIFGQQDIKVVLLQNHAWSTAHYLDRPTIYRGNYLEYNDENTTTFQAGREWRWIDLRSVRLMSERMIRLDKQPTRTDVYIKPDGERRQQVDFYYRDLNGMYTIESTDNNNPFWQSDYAYTHFTFVPPGNKEYPGRNIYVFGQLTEYRPDEYSKMEFNNERGVYEKTLLLKQGFYNYSYVSLPAEPSDEQFSFENTEGNYWSTENSYQIFVYYRPFGGRADELIGFASISSLFQRP